MNLKYSASSGNSGELTTVKNLKRSKNKGRKKKARTKQQSQSRPIKLTEPIQEVQESSLPSALDQMPTLTTDLNNTDDATTKADDRNLANKQLTGKWQHRFKHRYLYCVGTHLVE